MKKFLTLVLALVLALGLTVPAMAFTSDTSEEDDSIPYGLSVYLVEYDDNDFFGIMTLPESDRGYAKNEIVAAVVELEIPEDEDIVADGYTMLEISGDNVDFDVNDDYIMNDDAEDAIVGGLVLTSDGEDGWHIDTDDFEDDVTYAWLVFAKVTDDEASITAKLIDGTEGEEFASETSSIDVTLSGVDYTIDKDKPADDDGDYTISWADDGDGYAFSIDVDEDNKSIGMSIAIAYADVDEDDLAFNLGVNTKGELGLVKGAVIDTSGDDFDAIMDVYEDTVVGVFGLDYFNIGNYVRDSFFEDLTSGDTLTATVDIEPWTAYVVVPDNIVVDPPKTGDAASIVGFVMVALAGGSAVALKKRG